MPKTKPARPSNDNPAWTDADFARAEPFTQLPGTLRKKLTAVRGRGPQKTPTKVRTALRLSPEVIEHFQAGGPGWQTRIDDALRATIRPSPPKRASLASPKGASASKRPFGAQASKRRTT